MGNPSVSWRQSFCTRHGLRTLHAMTLRTLPASRFDAVDALRGLAMVWMTVFHFCFDLNHFGLARLDFYADPFWLHQRTLILSLFLFTAGLGQAIAVQRGQSWPRFWRRWGQVAACAALVSAGSYLMFGPRFIYFGTLHGIASMLVVMRLTASWGRLLWWLGGASIAISIVANYAISTGTFYEFPSAFDEKWLNWLGIIRHKPQTEDYVPIFPWIGVMWWGLAVGNWLMRRQPAWLTHALPDPSRAVKALAGLGRWSLAYYMLHQPMMIAALTALSWASTGVGR